MNANRTDDAMHWYHTTGGLLIICICVCIITGVIAGIYFGGPSLPSGNASTSSAVARPAAQQQTQWQSIRDAARDAGFQFGADVTDDRQALNFLLQRANNSVSDEEHRFVDAYRTAKHCQSFKGNLPGIRSVSMLIRINDALAKDKDAFLRTVQPDIELRLRQAGIKVVEAPAPADALLQVDVDGFWSSDGVTCTWLTSTSVNERTHVIRHDQHYELTSTIWHDGDIQTAGSNRFNGFTKTITEQITSFLNDYLAANQP